jgi:hypothetical protein
MNRKPNENVAQGGHIDPIAFRKKGREVGQNTGSNRASV